MLLTCLLFAKGEREVNVTNVQTICMKKWTQTLVVGFTMQVFSPLGNQINENLTANLEKALIVVLVYFVS